MLKKIGGAYIEGLSDMYSMFDEETKTAFRNGVNYLKQVKDPGETLFSAITKRYGNNVDYSDDVKNLAMDIGYFIINSKLDGLDEGMNKLPYNITVNQFQLLLCIGENKMDSISKLESHLGSSGSTLSIGVSKLVDKGYLKKEYPSSDDDGRKVYIRLTDNGREVLSAVNEAVRNRFKKYLSNLSDEKIQMFNRACDSFLQAFKKIME